MPESTVAEDLCCIIYYLYILSPHVSLFTVNCQIMAKMHPNNIKSDIIINIFSVLGGAPVAPAADGWRSDQDLTHTYINSTEGLL